MGTRRKSKNTAKTGDKAIYKRRAATEASVAGKKNPQSAEDLDDHMYNTVDKFYKQRDEALDQDILQFNDGDGNESDESSDDDGIVKNREEVFNLGLNDDDEDDDDDNDDVDIEGNDKDDSDQSDQYANKERAKRSSGFVKRNSDSASSDDDASSENSSSDDDTSEDDKSNDEEGEETIQERVLNWGGRKAAYYQEHGGDTKKLERKVARERSRPLRDEELEEAHLEGDAAKEVLQARYAALDMEDEDFFPDNRYGRDKKVSTTGEASGIEKADKRKLTSAFDFLGKNQGSKEQASSTTKLDISFGKEGKLDRLSDQEKLRILSRQNPELLPLLQYVTEQVLDDFQHNTLTVSKQLLSTSHPEQAEEVGATKKGLQYLRYKQMLQASTLLNTMMYMLLKCEQSHKQQIKHVRSSDAGDAKNVDSSENAEEDISNPQQHPVVGRLHQLQKLLERGDKKIEEPFGLEEQIKTLVQASALMADENENAVTNPTSDQEGSESSSEESSDDDENGEILDREQNRGQKPQGPVINAISKVEEIVDEVNSEEEDMDELEEAALHEDARFSVRDHDFDTSDDIRRSRNKKRKIKSSSRRPAPMTSDTLDNMGIGDDDLLLRDEERARRAKKSLSSTVNTIAQKERTNAKKRSAALSGSGIGGDLAEDDDDMIYSRPTNGTDDGPSADLQKGLNLMDQMLGDHSSDDDNSFNKGKTRDKGKEGDGDSAEDADDDDFYKKIQQRSKAKKDYKEQKYAVAPKYPSLEEEVVGERVAGRMIMKNRGLVPHRPKIQRNPRVKKREQYRKRLIQRRGAVREMRPQEFEGYGGEATGIKSGLSRSRRFGSRK